MNSIAELVAAYRTDKLKLPAVFEALAARGALPEVDYQAEVAWLERQRAEGALDPLIIKALLAKLVQVQTSPAGSAADADVTVVKPATQRPVAPPGTPGDADATVVQPTSRPASPVSPPPAPVTDEATVVKPASRPPAPPPPPAGDEVTMVKPASARRVSPPAILR